MDGLTLLREANDRGHSVAVVGDELLIRGPRSCADLVAEIGRHKAEVVAVLRGEPAPDDPPDWSALSAQRWGTDDAPGIDVRADPGRAEVAGWPAGRWSAWRRRVDELTPPRAEVAAIRAAEERAYDEIHGEQGATMMSADPTPPPPPTARPDRAAYRLDELAGLLGVSRRTIERERSAGRFPAADLRMGKAPLWRPETIRKWMDAGGQA